VKQGALGYPNSVQFSCPRVDGPSFAQLRQGFFNPNVGSGLVEDCTHLYDIDAFNAEWKFFSLLRDEGRRSAQVPLESNASGLGRRSTLDLDVLLEQI
jgi:hypothetical protein